MVNIDQLINWLKESGEDAAATFLKDCSLEWIYVDLAFELTGDREWHIVDVNIEVTAKTLKQAPNNQSSIETIENALREPLKQQMRMCAIHAGCLNYPPPSRLLPSRRLPRLPGEK
jgi:hypothetical protein